MQPRGVLLAVGGALLAGCASNPPLDAAENLRRQCRYDEARQMLESDLTQRKGQERARALMLLGHIEDSAGDVDAALQRHEESVAALSLASPLREQATRELGLAQTRARRYEVAIATLTEYLSLYADRVEALGHAANSDSPDWVTYVALATSLAESGRYRESAATYAFAARGMVPGARRDALLEKQRLVAGAAAGAPKPEPDALWSEHFGRTAPARTNFPPEALHRVAPEYPIGARVGGYVDLEISLSETGTVTGIVVKESDPPGLYDEAAAKAMRRWRFKPAYHDCRAAPGSLVQRLVFPPPAENIRIGPAPAPRSRMRPPPEPGSGLELQPSPRRIHGSLEHPDPQ